MGYTTEVGHIALRYLLLRINRDLIYSEKQDGADFFIKSYTGLFDAHLQYSGWVCPQLFPFYANELALRAYGTGKAKQELTAPSDCFLWMSFVYVVCISQHTSFDIGRGLPDLLAIGREIGTTRETMLHFLHEITDHMWHLQQCGDSKFPVTASYV